MQFRIAGSFTRALAKLGAQEQSAAKITVFDLQQNPAAPSLQFHRVNKSKDPNFWSIRAGRDVRVIVHKTADSFLICHVDRHDDAYKWAERRRIETHPKTGAAQIVEGSPNHCAPGTAAGAASRASQRTDAGSPGPTPFGGQTMRPTR